jgi:predicted MPP superfamily phosphohydrolase
VRYSRAALDELIRLAFPALAVITWAIVPVYAWVQRGRTFAIFSSIVIGLSLAGGLVVHSRLPAWLPSPWLAFAQVGLAFGMAMTALHYGHLVHARMRGPLFRRLVSMPGQVFIAASFMATLWMLVLLVVRVPLWALDQTTALRWLAPLDLLPYAIGLVAAFTSHRPPREIVRMQLAPDGPEAFTRVPVQRRRHRRGESSHEPDRQLRVVQISDPHLGPWQSVDRLKRLVADLVDHSPDLVLLTGDFLTMESNATPGALADALAPLRALSGRCYAIFGNHDHEAPDEVRHGLAANGIQLLIDDCAVHETAFGPVQIVGADYVRSERRAHLAELLERHPRQSGHLRLLMLHDPSAFHDLPDDDVDLVLSGHTHGGQVGLVSFGFDWTVLSRSRWPDHGLFARGRSRLYVHRGTGFYGFPLRVGVPGEASLLEVLWDPST